MTYIFEFEVIPGKANEFWAFMEKTGAPFWTKYKEVKSYKVFTKIGGEPIYEGHVFPFFLYSCSTLLQA